SIILPLSRLTDQFNEPYDSIKKRLAETQYHTASFRKADTLQYDTLAVQWLNDSTLIFDTVEFGRPPVFLQKTVSQKIIDSLVFVYDSITVSHFISDSTIRISDSTNWVSDSTILVQDSTLWVMDSTFRIRDTIFSEKDIITQWVIDSALLQSKNVQLFKLTEGQFVPGLFPAGSDKSYRFFTDSSKIVISEPVQVIMADQHSPFNIVANEKVPDSLHIAVQTLLSYTNKRDSIKVYLTNIEGYRTPFWLTVGDDELYRYWVKNQKNDSVTIWMGNPDKSNITFVLEDDIIVERIEKETVDDVPFTMATPLFELAEVEPLKEIPVYWDYDFSSSFSLSQNYLSNWAKGGENSFSSIVDIGGQAKYTNKEAKREWTNSGRLKYGSIFSEEHGLRKNTDLLEFNSQFNKELIEKLDFSALFYMKNQIAKGYHYPNDSVVISEFLNPGTFTIGLGAEYKPFKKSSINLSPLSYKNTFVLDTANIDQTIHGIDNDKRANQEMGGQLLIKNDINVFDDLNIKNSLRLFSNYLDKPQNVDIDWEINLEKQLSMFFTVILNVHVIYDDDIRFPVLDENEDPVLLPDGNAKKVPKLQLKQYLGLTFLFKL
ncbi:MAG: DUF3078 domain-containing protein, partial [Bacteroidota bacterium]